MIELLRMMREQKREEPQCFYALLKPWDTTQTTEELISSPREISTAGVGELVVQHYCIR